MQGNRLKQYSGLLIIGIILIVIYKMFDTSWFSILLNAFFPNYNWWNSSLFFGTFSTNGIQNCLLIVKIDFLLNINELLVFY